MKIFFMCYLLKHSVLWKFREMLKKGYDILQIARMSSKVGIWFETVGLMFIGKLYLD